MRLGLTGNPTQPWWCEVEPAKAFLHRTSRRLTIVNDIRFSQAYDETGISDKVNLSDKPTMGTIMTNLKTSLKQVVIAGGALFVAIAAPIEASRFTGYDINVISVASAAEDGHAGQANAKGTKGGTGSKQGGSQGGPQVGSSGKGSKSTEALLKGDGGSTNSGKASTSAKGGPGEDSDRPPTAGVKGGKSTSGGGKPSTSGSKKGDLFGDLFVLIRNPVTGAALTEVIGTTTYPLVQAYDVNGVLLPGVSIPRDAEGNLVLTGTLPSGTPYTYTTKEVEFGRLSVGRSPTKVLDHSLVEAVTKLIAADASSTDNIAIVLDASGRLAIATTTTDPVTGLPVTTVKAIDSPLENLALYKAIANLTGTDRTITVAVPASKDGGTAATTLTWTVPTSINIDLLKASLLAAAGDKTGTITLDTVMYINPIVGVTDDLSTFTYDRYTTYKDLTVTVLIKQADGITYIATPVKVYDVVFSGTNDTTVTGAADFATAVNDALQVLEYVHDNAI
jgi:hypothetical protein